MFHLDRARLNTPWLGEAKATTKGMRLDAFHALCARMGILYILISHYNSYVLNAMIMNFLSLLLL